MEASEFISKKKALLDRKAKLEQEINAEYTKHCQEYIAANCPVEKGKVYEVVEGAKKRDYKRFVVYESRPVMIFDTLAIQVGGWWLDKDSVPKKWECRYVSGTMNPTLFALSDNQINKPHPDSKQAAEQVA